MATEPKTLKLDQIRIDGGTQPRVAIDQGIVDEYAEKYSNGVDFKPVIVFFDGATYWLADGFHRYWANKRIDCDYIFANVHQGTQRDAILYSVGANATHGLRRTNADKRKAVLTMLTDTKVSLNDDGNPWSDSEIARRCAVDHKTVKKHRDSIHTWEFPSMEEGDRRTFLHHKTGKPTTMRTGNIGRSSKRKFNPTGGIARDAFRTRQPHSQGSPVPMVNIDLPLNNPQKAAKCMFSVYGEEYMRALCEELNAIFSKKGISNDNE
ncbi:MAG: hypothetical protein KAU28_10180 [Phycisphaerae bacterium]|nr:hypothetical protein [Phycisphaerae bacterium]